jgi:hypothetical protein
MGTRDSFVWVKRPGREADLIVTSVYDKRTWLGYMQPPPHTLSWHCPYLARPRENFTFTFTLPGKDCLCCPVVSFWLQIQRSGTDSRHYQIFWEVVDLERGPLSLVGTIEDLLERKNSGSGLENREYGLKIRHADHVVPSIRKSCH